MVVRIDKVGGEGEGEGEGGSGKWCEAGVTKRNGKECYSER